MTEMRFPWPPFRAPCGAAMRCCAPSADPDGHAPTELPAQARGGVAAPACRLRPVTFRRLASGGGSPPPDAHGNKRSQRPSRRSAVRSPHWKHCQSPDRSPSEAIPSSCSSRPRGDHQGAFTLGRKSHASEHILMRELREILQQLGLAAPGGQGAQNIADGEPSASHTRLAKADGWVNRDAIEQVHPFS